MSFRTALFLAVCGLASPDLLMADDSEDDRKAARSPSSLQNDVAGEERILKSLQEKTSDEFQEQFTLFLEKVPAGRPGASLKNVDSSLLLARHWQQLQNVPLELQDRELARFLGRLEGECRVTAPEWWVDRLLSIRIEKDGYVMHRPVPPTPFWTRLNDKWLAIKGNPVRFSDDLRILAQHESGEVDLTTVTQEAFFYLPENPNLITVATHQESLFVGLLRPLGIGYPLVAFDATSGKVLWTSTVWAAGIGSFSGPIPKYGHCAEIVPDEDRLFVFGDCYHGTYCECRRASDGYVLFRFIGRREFPANLWRE